MNNSISFEDVSIICTQILPLMCHLNTQQLEILIAGQDRGWGGITMWFVK